MFPVFMMMTLGLQMKVFFIFRIYRNLSLILQGTQPDKRDGEYEKNVLNNKRFTNQYPLNKNKHTYDHPFQHNKERIEMVLPHDQQHNYRSQYPNRK